MLSITGVFQIGTREMAFRKRFFILTPYGNQTGTDEDKATHDLVTGLRKNIIDKAVDRLRERYEFDVVAEFGSDTAQGGNIWVKIGEQMSRAHGVIAVVATSKPNTFIELGLAYGLWFNPIILHFEDFDMPSDINGEEVRPFTRSQALGDEDASDVVDWLEARMLDTPVRADRITPSYLPSTTSSDGKLRTYDRFSKAVSPAEWSNVLWEAEREIILAAPKLLKLRGHGWLTRPTLNEFGDVVPEPPQEATTLTELLGEKVALDGVNLTILLPHRSNQDERDLKRPMDEDALADHKAALHSSRNKWFTFKLAIDEARQRAREEEEPNNIGQVRVILLKTMRFPYRMTMTDKRLLLTLRFYREQFDSRFCIDARPQSFSDQFETPLFPLLRQDVQAIIDADEYASEVEYQDWLAQR